MSAIAQRRDAAGSRSLGNRCDKNVIVQNGAKSIRTPQNVFLVTVEESAIVENFRNRSEHTA